MLKSVSARILAPQTNNMKTLAKQISNLLFDHDCVIVPGLGGFITNYKPATIHPHHHIFNPPSKQISFNAALTHNDGVLINSYVVHYGISYGQAGKAIDSAVRSIRISLLKGESITLENVGILKSNTENNIEFKSFTNINYLGDAFGLPRFDFYPVNREQYNSVAGLSRPAVRKTMRWAAILVPLVAIALWTTNNPNTFSKIQNNYAGLVTTPEKTISIPARSSEKTVNYDDHQKQELNGTITNSVSETQLPEKPIAAEVIENKTIFHIVAGAFSIPENAERLVNDLKKQGFESATIVGKNGKDLLIVSIANYTDKVSADSKLIEIKQNDFPEAWLLEKTN